MTGTTINLPPRQLAVATFIRDYRRRHGYAPTLAEIGEALGISKVNVRELILKLEWRGVVRRDARKARGVEIIAGMLDDVETRTKLPVLASIAAGRPIEATMESETIDLEDIFHSPRGCFVLRARGDSMKDDHILDGDFVIIERRDQARNGEQVVAELASGGATLKRFYREPGNKVRLQPANASMSAQILDASDVKVQGVVIGVLRSYMA